MENKSFVSACGHVGTAVGVLSASSRGFWLRAGKITLRSPLVSGSKPVQPLDPEARHLQCSMFVGSSVAVVLSQFVRRLEEEQSYPGL